MRRSIRSHAIRSFALFLVVTFTATGLGAQTSHAQDRSGMWYQFGLGTGSMGCEGCRIRKTGGAGMLAIGKTFTPRFQLGGIVDMGMMETDGLEISLGTIAALARFYPMAKGGFFLQSGIGVASLQVSGSAGSGSDDGTAFLGGIGYDIRIRKNMSITPYLSHIASSFKDGEMNQNQIGVALTWH